MNAKRCSKCGKLRLLEMFRADRRNRDRLQSHCKPCQRLTLKAWRLSNKEKVRETQLAWNEANKDKLIAARRVWISKNLESVAATKRRWAESNRDKRRAYDRIWTQSNPAKKCARTRLRQAAVLQRTPAWLTDEHIEEMADFYEAARMFRLFTGQDYHVDHIVPLQGVFVSGLHTPWNLQLMLASDNLKKNRKFLQDQYNQMVSP